MDKMDFLINYLINERGEKINIPTNYQDKRNLLRSLMNIRQPGEITEEFIKIQDEFLTNENLNRKLTSPKDITEVKGKLMLWKGDIITLKVDSIVNAANSKLLGCFIPLHNCIDNVIHSASGIQLRNECDKLMKVQGRDEDVGLAKITNAYNLPSKYVIHTVGPAINQGCDVTKNDCEKLASCYESCLDIANQHELKSIAFCSISTGVFNFPHEKAGQIAIKTVNNYLNNHETTLKHIIFNVFSDEDYMIYKNLLFGD